MLETVDLKKKLSKPVYTKTIAALQERLRRLQYAAKDAEIPVIVCLEGWDTCGRGEVVKKLTERLDPRICRVRRVMAPTPLELRYHFLRRYQVALPNDGEMVVFDHSWYGRVLVERCDKLTPKKQWRLAYEQINQFERWLTEDSQVLVKFWLHISQAEQKKHFQDCLRDPLRKWKITAEYRRHHKQYDRWVEAVEEMLARTDSPHAPWTVVAATDLRWARVQVFQTLVSRLEEALERRKAQPQLVSRSAAARPFMHQLRSQLEQSEAAANEGTAENKAPTQEVSATGVANA
jgi:polyphosphate kinase 2 (PPK2 family)